MCVRIKRSHSDGRLKNHHPMGGLGSIGKEITFHTGPLDLMGTGAGDRNPYLEMEITWTPEGEMSEIHGESRG